MDLARVDEALVLTGLPGAGKTSVGRLLATRLGRPFADGDAEVERAMRRMVAAMWAERGEAGFRAAERDVTRALLARGDRPVIAAGGGALLDDGTRLLALARALVIWLDVPVPVLLDRLAAGPARPVLGPDPAASLARLAAEREATYATSHLRVPYAPGPPEATVEAVLRAFA